MIFGGGSNGTNSLFGRRRDLYAERSRGGQLSLFPPGQRGRAEERHYPRSGWGLQAGPGDLPSGAGKLRKPAHQPQYPELLVRHGGGLLVGCGGVSPTGGGPLHQLPGRERPDRWPDVADSGAGVEAAWPQGGDHLLCPAPGQCGDHGGSAHQHGDCPPECDRHRRRPHLRAERGQPQGPPERDLHAPPH